MWSSSTPQSPSFLGKHEFFIRRLHSLAGLVPVGAYLVIHLLVNSSIVNGAATYQQAVYRIHSLGAFLPVVEWVFIFIPILFHGLLGVALVWEGHYNTGTYRYGSNIRYTWQRITGVIAFLFIGWHVFHMHGWFHFEAWRVVVEYLRGANFRPYNAATSLAAAMGGLVVPTLYAIGTLSCVFHLANGIWTMGITWGVWISPAAQRRAARWCLAIGIGVAAMGLGALIGPRRVEIDESLGIEDALYQAKITSGELLAEEAEHKRWSPRERHELQHREGQPAGNPGKLTRRDKRSARPNSAAGKRAKPSQETPASPGG